ncbi:TIGR00730 family Rossman fold protein [Actibacterium sp. MT2.3-13A]|uniref:LOG family protein n=1 Tax=Actibacterium sp. MT2.3-13A TaxID=2828332 RepID=UPI001BA5F9EA|nr:TIGR00730 family Rossman fold protein [Actibacterium sp. MT2.3-13A]
MPAMPRSVCVFCGSRVGRNPAYAQAAEDTGRAIAAEGWRLVYGAGDVGLMGRVARATQEAGGQTFGVIPLHLFEREVGKRDLSTLIVTENMHERKKVMFMNSDAIVVLPGGAGSLDEFFEVLTWRQLGLHEKPILLLSANGFWEPLSGLIDHFIAEGFADPGLRDFVHVVADIPALTAALRAALS